MMIDFIIKLEDMLKLAGYPDWEITQLPDSHSYVLKLDGDVIHMTKIEKEKEDGNL